MTRIPSDGLLVLSVASSRLCIPTRERGNEGKLERIIHHNILKLTGEE